MADGHDIHLEAELAQRLLRAAEAVGMTIDEYVTKALDQFVDDDWASARAALSEYDRTGVCFDAREALAEFAAGVAEDHASRKA